MRLLLDEMITATVAGELRDRGHDVVAALEHQLQAHPDDDSSWIRWLQRA